MQYKAPEIIPPKGRVKAVFLAGTIDMGSSEDWQSKIAARLPESVDKYNPRREQWDSSWKQDYFEPAFYQQVKWEIEAMEKADVIIFNFLPDSNSIITMLELGLHAKSGKAIVCCPDEFHRAGNVHVICSHYDIPLYKNMNDLLKCNMLKNL
jgi:hypothetical protein